MEAPASGGDAAVPTTATSALRPSKRDVVKAELPLLSTAASSALEPSQSELSRLFVVCGRGRKVDELRALFSSYGTIKHLHLALDRSKKSRVRLSNAAAAMKKLDLMKLDDGHILKVTIAKERPVGTNGKLKRGQHARQDPDEKAGDGIHQEDDGGMGARLPGKRQRSSPPAAALPAMPCRLASSIPLQAHHLKGSIASHFAEVGSIKQEPRQDTVPIVGVVPDRLVGKTQTPVRWVLDTMLMIVEQQAAYDKNSAELFADYQHVAVTANRGTGENLSVVVPRATDESGDESSTEMLTSSIRSVSLASTPMAMKGSPPNVSLPRLATREAVTLPSVRNGKQHLRRRRQSLDGSDSSTEDGSDGSGIRRKRSNTTTSPPPTLNRRIRGGNLPPWSPPRKFSDRSDFSLSPEALKSEGISKKQCKRQSSDHSIEGAYRLVKQQATRASGDRDGNGPGRRSARPGIAATDSSLNGRHDVKLELEPAPTRTKLFFTSTYKVRYCFQAKWSSFLLKQFLFLAQFTSQELEAMFAVYGDFESVELVKSFGRVRTMAYVRYSMPTTAAFVVKSFREETSQGEGDPEKAEFMAVRDLYMAISEAQSPPHQRAKLGNVYLEDASTPTLGLNSNFKPESAALASEPTIPTALATAGKVRLWILLLYDRFLATHMLSSVVLSYSGMEFMDIKVVKSTGEAQGVAFVKFDSERNATQAALQLHQMELPLGSGKFLQAIVILAPSLFTTTHGNNAIGNDEPMRLDHTAGERVVSGSSDDVDLRTVEARFAHLMRNNEHQQTREGYTFPQYPPLPPVGARAGGLDHPPLSMTATAYSPPTSAGYHSPMGSSTPMEYYPMQLVAYPPPPQQQFQPYPMYGASGIYQQQPQQQAFGAAVPTWMEAAGYYPSGAPQYPFSYAAEQQMTYPVAHIDNNGAARAAASDGGGYGAAMPSRPRSTRSSSEQMDAEDGNSSSSSTLASPSIYVSTSQPLELVRLVTALHDCPGVVAFTKDTATAADATAYIVDFGKEAQALDAVRKLDGSLCDGQKLRVATSTSTKQRGGGGKSRAGSGRRKRQRVDPRSRK
ncbi:hypothetical protein BBJ28_00003426 [Nothophytophthora sp. Chile5]|nr:hypothetical protein BBJ28_00003426 [Nothophytophthora sp. Chile5]